MGRSLVLVSWLALALATPAQAADLALKRVVLSSAGLGLYEYEAEIEGDSSVELAAPLDQVDDILKSLVVFDDRGGVGGLDLPAPRPLADAFRDLPFTPADLQSTPRLLAALRGAEIEATGPHALKGRVLAVAEEKETRPDGTALTTRHRVTVATDAGLASFLLEDADGVRFADPALRAALAKALDATATDAERGSRRLRLTSKGAGPRTLHVAYLASAPIWKVAYRLALGGDGAAEMQGWATLENLSGQDWRGVDLTLVSGRAAAYRQALYRVYRAARPEAPVDIAGALTPEVDNGALPAVALRDRRTMDAKKAGTPAVAGEATATPRLQAPPDADAAEAPVEAREGETEVAFHLPHPVSVADGRTLSLPIVEAKLPAAALDLYQPQTDARHPLAAVELTNASGATLPPGLVTIYDGGAGAVTYAGDARLSATPPGEKRLLAYALDGKTRVESSDGGGSQLQRARVAKGLLTLDELTRQRTLYRVTTDKPRKLVVFTPKIDGARLTEPDAARAQEADGKYRVAFDLKPGDPETFAVTQERTETSEVTLATLDDANLDIYVKNGEIDADTRAALQKLAGLRATEAKAARALEAAKTAVSEIESDQIRLKTLLTGVSASSDLAKRYLKSLDDDETQLERGRATIAARERDDEAARAALEGFLAGG